MNSFTDRYIPIDAVGTNNTLVMAQPAFQNNIIGYDTMIHPDVDHGFFIENVLALLDEANEYYLNSSTGQIYYKPPNGTSINSMHLVLARLEQLLVVSGTYDSPVHDITFEGFNYMHTTWSKSLPALTDDMTSLEWATNCFRLPLHQRWVRRSADWRLHWSKHLLHRFRIYSAFLVAGPWFRPGQCSQRYYLQ